MGGYDFEHFVKILFENMGYSVEHTSLSGDQGADLIATKFGEKTSIQVKRYSGSVSNSSVQEVVASKNYYNCDKCMVVTNSYFTKSAIELASANSVELINRDKLHQFIDRYM
ncbi:restriction endonuclease [Methanococcoides sp. SA1]|nr:restriction endonuclease [Methanococcoides sp. SA1]